MVKEPPGASVYTRYHCSLPVPEPSAHSQYTVSVKHLEQGKFIMSYNHSECACLCLSSQYYRGPLSCANKYKSLLGIFAFATFKELQIFHSQ